MLGRPAFVIAAILIALPAFAQPKGGDWVVDPRTHCKVWNEAPFARAVSWSGACRNGLASGRGVQQWFFKGEAVDRFEGEMVDGKRNGRGTYFMADGNRFEGEFENDQWGRGVLLFGNGSRFEGVFKDYKFSGHAVTIHPDGRFEGEYRDDNRNGHGVYTWTDGTRFEGEYRDGRRNGHGVQVDRNGSRFEGEFRDDKPNGFGTFVSGGKTYAGNWTNGCFKQGDLIAWIDTTDKACGF